YQTDASGRYRIPVLPGKGVLAVGLHGQRYHFLGKSWVTQAGRSYRDGGMTIDSPEDPLMNGNNYVTDPAILSTSLYQQLALIAPSPDSEAIPCDMQVSSQSRSTPEAKP